MKQSGIHEQVLHNVGENSSKLVHFWAQFFLATHEKQLDYYHQKAKKRPKFKIFHEKLFVFVP